QQSDSVSTAVECQVSANREAAPPDERPVIPKGSITFVIRPGWVWSPLSEIRPRDQRCQNAKSRCPQPPPVSRATPFVLVMVVSVDREKIHYQLPPPPPPTPPPANPPPPTRHQTTH